MSACEKCWRDASARAFHLGGFVSDHYRDLLAERANNPCSEAEQRGDEHLPHVAASSDGHEDTTTTT